MIEKLKCTYDILNILENQNSKKFVSSALNDVNKILDLDLKEYSLFNKEVNNANISEEEKKLIDAIIYKIEELEAQILPKANLINSFSNTLS